MSWGFLFKEMSYKNAQSMMLMDIFIHIKLCCNYLFMPKNQHFCCQGMNKLLYPKVDIHFLSIHKSTCRKTAVPV